MPATAGPRKGKTMKRTLAICAVLIASLAACGGGSSGCGGGASSEKHDVTLIIGVRGDTFYSSMICGAQAAADKLGVNLEVQGAEQWDASLQTPIVNAAVAAGPDAILIAPTDDTALQAPLQQAAADGIEVVLVDTTVKDPSFAASQVTSDNRAAGENAAKDLAELLGGKGSVLTIDVKPGISTTGARVEGFREGLRAHPGITDLGVQYSDDQPAKAASIVTSTLAAHPDLAGIFVTNTLTGEGAATGLRSSGRSDQVKVVGFDASPAGVEALQQDLIQAQVVLKPYDIGQIGVEQAVAALEGGEVRKEVLTGSLVATRDNLDDPEIQKYLYKESCA
jgi:ribose transport system substrate-binding protein